MAEEIAESPKSLPENKATREAWLEERRKGIGGSDAPAICGLDPFRGPMAVWLDKTGQLPNIDAGEPARWGKLLEDPITDEFERRTGRWVHRRQEMLVHPSIPYMRATLDGFVYDRALGDGVALGVYEGKTTSGRSYDWNDGVPDHVKIQVQHNMFVAGLPRAWVACLVMAPAVELRIYEIEADAAAINELVGIETEFWKMVLERRPPPSDGSWGTLEATRKAYASSTRRAVELGARGLDLARRRDAAWLIEKDARAQKYAVESEIMMLLGEADEGTCEGVTLVTWKSQKRTAVDPEILRNDYPEIAAAVSTTTSNRVLRFKKVEGL